MQLTGQYQVVTWGVYISGLAVGSVKTTTRGSLKLWPYTPLQARVYDANEQRRHPITPREPAR